MRQLGGNKLNQPTKGRTNQATTYCNYGGLVWPSRCGGTNHPTSSWPWPWITNPVKQMSPQFVRDYVKHLGPTHWRCEKKKEVDETCSSPSFSPAQQVYCGSGPAYLSELLHVYTPSRTLRSSSDTRMLEIQQYKRKTHGFRTFSCFGPHIWNSLPQDLRHCATLSSFKAKLKTFLFSEEKSASLMILF